MTVTVGTTYITMDPPRYVPTDLSLTDLVVFTADGERFPTQGAYHGLSNGTLEIEDVPDLPCTLQIGTSRFETSSGHDFIILDTVVGAPEDVATGLTFPFDVSIRIFDWQAGDHLTIIEDQHHAIITGVEKQLSLTNPQLETYGGTVAWPERVPAAFETFVMQHHRTSQLSDGTTSTVLIGTSTLQVDTTGHAAGSMDTIRPDRNDLATIEIPSPDPIVGPRQWSVATFVGPGSRYGIIDGVPTFTAMTAVGAEQPVASVPEFQAFPEPLLVSTYFRTRDLGVTGIQVTEGIWAAGTLESSAARFTPLLTLPIFYLDDLVPARQIIDPYGPPIEVALDPLSLADGVPDDQRDMTMRATWVGGGVVDHSFVLHGAGSKLYLPVESIFPGDYVITIEMTANGQHASSSAAVTLLFPQ